MADDEHHQSTAAHEQNGRQHLSGDEGQQTSADGGEAMRESAEGDGEMQQSADDGEEVQEPGEMMLAHPLKEPWIQYGVVSLGLWLVFSPSRSGTRARG